MNSLITNDFKKIVLEDTPLIDVRAPIEYIKGAFQNSTNLPILTDEERHLVGTYYKEKGNEEATALGHRLVSGAIKDSRIEAWHSFITNNPTAMIYCFRGGSRSSIAQKWINESSSNNIVKLDGGYKAFRNYLIDSFTEESKKITPIILTGLTGSGKTTLLNNLHNSIDLEGIANHRGSSFGNHPSPQPTQINFENNLAYALIKHTSKGYKNLIVEDEGRNIGRNFMPKQLTDVINTGNLILLDVPIEDRIINTLNEYVTIAQREYIELYGEDAGLTNWFNYITDSMNKVKNKLGGDRFNYVISLFNEAYKKQLSTGNIEYHIAWIEMFLKEYYDPLYTYSLNKGNKNILFKGNYNEVLSYLKTLK